MTASAPRGLACICFSLVLLRGLVCAHQGAAAEGEAEAEAASWRDEVGRAFREEDGRGLSDERVERLEEDLRPLFAALPKNSRGLLGPAAVRYALHRHFARAHGVHVRGLEPPGANAEKTARIRRSPPSSSVFEAEVPSYLLRLFEADLRDGFGPKELAMLAACLEHFAKYETIAQMKDIYRMLDHSIEELLSQEDLDRVMELYMAVFMMVGRDLDVREGQNLTEAVISKAASTFSSFGDILTRARTVWKEVIEQKVGRDGAPVSFMVVINALVAVLQNFRRQHDAGCREMSKTLVTKESRLSGRVKLSDFHQAGPTFAQSKEHLLEIGAAERVLTSFGSEEIHVRIPSYVSSAANCLATANVYSVCCADACEGLLNRVEARAAAPAASPEDVASAVAAGLRLETVEAPWALPEPLFVQLRQIADAHGGKVPLHGRPFALWLHHAFPRECPFPARPGADAARPVTADDWLREGSETSADEEREMDRLTRLARRTEEVRRASEEDEVQVSDLVDGHAADAELPWDSEEELVFHTARPTVPHEVRILLRAASAVGALYGLTKVILVALGVGRQRWGRGAFSKGDAHAF